MTQDVDDLLHAQEYLDEDDFYVLKIPSEGVVISNLEIFFSRVLKNPELLELIPTNARDKTVLLTEYCKAKPLDGNQWLTLQCRNTNWDLIPEILSIREPIIRIESSPDYIGGQITAIATISKLEFLISIDLPSFRAHAYLLKEDQSTSEIKPLLDKLHLNGIGFDHLCLQDANLLVDVDSKTLIFHLEIDDVLELGPVSLKELQFDLIYGGDLGTITGAISAEIEICNVLIQVFGEHLSPGEGWQLQGIADFKDGLSIVELICHFDKDLHESDFPEAISSLKLKRLELSFNTQTKEFRFSGEAGDWKLLDVLAIQNPLIILECIDDKISGRFSAAPKIETTEFFVSVDLPTFNTQILLSPDTPCSVASLLKGFNLNSVGGDIDKLTLKEATLLSSELLVVHLELEELLKVGPVNLKSIQLDLLRQPDQSSSSKTTGSIFAALDIAGVKLLLRGQYLGENQGWQLQGSASTRESSLSIAQIVEEFGVSEEDVPKALADIKIEYLEVDFNTQTKDFTFSCESKLLVDDKKLDIIITIEFRHNANGSFENLFGGHITFGELQFNLLFDKNSTSKTFVATYSHEGSSRLNLRRLFEPIFSDATVLHPLEDIEIDLKDALFAYSKTTAETTTTTKVLFGLDIGTNINLSNLPLVGKRLPPEQTVSVDDLQLLIASQDFTSEEIAAFNKLTPQGVTKIPEKSKADNGSSTENPKASSLPKGLNVAAKMQFGSTATSLALPVSAAPQPVSSNQLTSSASTPAVSTSTLDNVTWFNLKRSFGPVHFERVGVQYKDAVISFFVDVALSAAGLTLSFEGLSIGSPLSKFEPKYNIQGLGIDYESGSGLEIGGAFLKLGDDFVGTAIIRGEAFTLSAMGAYKELQGSPSLFIYAYLNYPLGGPAFFFVEGLAAGFGYNRHITIPTIAEVRNFPLVEDAIGPLVGDIAPESPDKGLHGSLQDANKVLEEKLTKLQKYVQPRVGEHFLAVGVKFNSFKQIDSFALLIIPFGQSFELDVLGISTMTVPSPEEGKTVTPVAQIQMVLKARFAPSEGVLSVQAQLTEQSYVFSPDCRLQGGFAFFSWFSGEHAGDFVITLGGYHPSFRVPAHYPQVPRLSFNWQKTPELSMKGDAYFALTSNVVMAGGHFEALWDGGDLRAWYRLGIDFLISWKPFHYEASAYIDIGASYTFSFFGRHTISVHVGADVEIWGPEFAGTAHVDLSIISFDISFGDRTTTPPKLSWGEFQASFLPAPDKTCSISVGDGLTGTLKQNGDSQEHWIINAKEFCLVANTLIPVFEEGNNSGFGIAPMRLTSQEFNSSKLSFEVKRDGTGVTGEFQMVAIQKQFPSALWGNNHNPHDTLNSEALETTGGYEFRPKELPTAGSSSQIRRQHLDYDVTPRDLRAEPNPSATSTLKDLLHDQDFYAGLRDLATDQACPSRNDLLQALGFEPSQAMNFTNISNRSSLPEPQQTATVTRV